MNNIGYALIFMAGLVGVFILTYIGNKNTPKPEGMEDLQADCSGCHDISCGHHSAHKE